MYQNRVGRLCTGLACLGLASAFWATPGRADNPPPGWMLVWSDEFSRDGPPDPEKWGYEQGFVRNQEAEWYQPENAVVKGGMLVIEARREHKANPN